MIISANELVRCVHVNMKERRKGREKERKRERGGFYMRTNTISKHVLGWS